VLQMLKPGSVRRGLVVRGRTLVYQHDARFPVFYRSGNQRKYTNGIIARSIGY
jgi:hypothetical protein